MEVAVVIGLVVTVAATFVIFRSPWKSEGSGNPTTGAGHRPATPPPIASPGSQRGSGIYSAGGRDSRNP